MGLFSKQLHFYHNFKQRGSPAFFLFSAAVHLFLKYSASGYFLMKTILVKTEANKSECLN